MRPTRILLIGINLALAGICNPGAIAQAPPGMTAGPISYYLAKRLYTPPDPAAKGGIHVTVEKLTIPISAAFAVPQSDQTLVYRGELDSNGLEARFTGLPVAKYDLMLVFHSAIFEGFSLNRDENSLTPEDIKSIEETVNKSTPFFEAKKIYRVMGTTGKLTGKATAVVEQLRRNGPGSTTLNYDAYELKGHVFRSLDVVFIEDVGPAGWQVSQDRQLARVDVLPPDPVKDFVPILYDQHLGSIRVTEAVKEVGPLHIPNPAEIR